jgi:hypothetical protein
MPPLGVLAAREEGAKLLSKNETGKAIDYSLKCAAALTRFLANGQPPLSQPLKTTGGQCSSDCR